MTTEGPPPTEPDPDGSRPAELRRSFWTLVAVFNVAVLATGLGLLLVGFRRQLLPGAAVLAVGLVTFAYGVRRYRGVREA